MKGVLFLKLIGLELMTPPNRILVIVAHPDDETLSFSSICRGADVISVTDGGWLYRGEDRAKEFHKACTQLGSRSSRIFNFPDIYPWSLPIMRLCDKLRELGSYERVYTHSPFDDHPHHRAVSLAVSKVFEVVWVPAYGMIPAQVEVMDESSFRLKVDIMNRIYPKELRSIDDYYQIPATSLTSVESFGPLSYNEILRALALTRPAILSEIDDVWGFSASPYELERYSLTCKLLSEECKSAQIKDVLEVGACEGAMTSRLRKIFPAAIIRAIEPHPVFAARLRRKFQSDKRCKIKQASVLDIALQAEIVILAEMLYYVADHIAEVLGRVQSQYLLTSYYGSFDAKISQFLQSLGWEEAAMVQLLPRFEAVDGCQSKLFACRAGTNIRLWRSS